VAWTANEPVQCVRLHARSLQPCGWSTRATTPAATTSTGETKPTIAPTAETKTRGSGHLPAAGSCPSLARPHCREQYQRSGVRGSEWPRPCGFWERHRADGPPTVGSLGGVGQCRGASRYHHRACHPQVGQTQGCCSFRGPSSRSNYRGCRSCCSQRPFTLRRPAAPRSQGVERTAARREREQKSFASHAKECVSSTAPPVNRMANCLLIFCRLAVLYVCLLQAQLLPFNASELLYLVNTPESKVALPHVLIGNLDNGGRRV
jgi:hypothetical protein